MTLESIAVLCNALAVPVGAVVGTLLGRAKYRAEVKTSELDNVRKANDMLMDVAANLERETKGLRRDVQRLRKAVEKIPLCPHAADCPVSRELQDGADRDEEREPSGAGQ